MQAALSSQKLTLCLFFFKFSKINYYTVQRPAKSKIFNPNPTRKKFLVPETRPELEKKFFQTEIRPELEKQFFLNRTPIRIREKNFLHFETRPEFKQILRHNFGA